MSNQNYPHIDKVLIFTLDELLYALPLKTVAKVIHVVEIRSLPKAPEIIAGIINVKGQIIPVVDLRKRFGRVTREIIPDDNLIITVTGKRTIALLVDTVSGIKELVSTQYTDTQSTLPFAEFIKGVAKTENEIILIYDLEQCLSLTEEMELEQALSKSE